ncbi:hypothetical protein BDB01DRAFT_846768 [Pilobolus umbonatus]|nr:hypothetical protein BDB01DRAFT_846768 [Pilobolus umbonatus]
MESDQAMKERIASLSRAIEQQKSINRGAIPSRGSTRGRGYPTPLPYRSRSGNMSISSVNKTYIKPPVNKPIIPIQSHNKTLISTQNAPPSLNKATPRRNLVLNNKNSVHSVDTAGRKQVSVDGVDFVVKGKKLIRKDLFDSAVTKSSLLNTAPKMMKRTTKSPKKWSKSKNLILGSTPPPIRKKTKLNRTQRGNMVFIRHPEGYVRHGRKSLILTTQKRHKPQYCGFYTRYGKCPKEGRCPFRHDPSRRAICPRFLLNRCKKNSNQCKLSHTPNEHIIPHCVHFQKGLCKNDPCIYSHVKVSNDAPVCKAFAMEGYCSKGNECEEKHVHVCPEFAETGKCSNANCRLPHVARRTTERSSDSSTKTSGIIRLGSWVSPAYFHAQKEAIKEKRKAKEEVVASKVWVRPGSETSKPVPAKTEKEGEGFVKLFDDSDDDDGWSQYQRDDGDSVSETTFLRFKDEEDEDEEDEGEEDEEDEDEDDEDEDENDEDEGASEMICESDDEVYEDAEEGDYEDAVEGSDIEEIYEVVPDDEVMFDADA